VSASGFAVAGKTAKKASTRRSITSLLARAWPTSSEMRRKTSTTLVCLSHLDAMPHPTEAEKELADLLTVLIENFEEQHYALRKATPVETLAELMDVNGLKQKDLVDIFGTPSIVSEVLSGLSTFDG